ncbi:MAG TPA: PQQ-binding-like beta-propeller repeat protein [Gammaproteobacteria bacterium]
MARGSIAFGLLGLALFAGSVLAQPSGDGSRLRAVAAAPVTDAMLRDPDPADWLMYSRTYDAQRYSPLSQIDKSNVASLALAWSKPLAAGPLEIIPLVHRGVMYLTTPGSRDGGSRVVALDAATGETLWEYLPPNNASSRIKALAISGDLIYYTAPAPSGEPNPVVALDAATGTVRWQAPVTVETHTAGAIVVEGKVISGRACNTSRSNCYIAAHDARTGKEAWRFYTSPGAGEPGDESWAGKAVDERRAAAWGLPGTYDPVRRLVYWGIANPMPNTRADRHGGNVDAIPRHAPADLYSNSTVALRPDTGELVWHYQHLPGDDWDMDINEERVLIRTVVDPDPRHVKWINPNVPKGVERDVAITVGEGGGVWVNDRATGEFLWAMPFPYDTEHFIIEDIDVETGVAHINSKVLLEEPGETKLVCYWNTRSFWPTAYSPKSNSLYVPYIDHCLSMTRAGESGGERRTSGLRPGADQAKLAGIAKIDMRTGEIRRIYEARLAGNGAMLATAGDLLFWGDIGQVLRAFDADTGKILWESEPLGATVQTSTITYAVDGKQYVAVINAESLLGAPRLAAIAGATIPKHQANSINVFALPR